jgi:hypothetical protein
MSVRVSQEDFFKFRRGGEAGGLDDVGDATVEALDHSVRENGSWNLFTVPSICENLRNLRISSSVS